MTATDPPEDLARAGVSLVRLLVNYTSVVSHVTSSFQCTGLGVLVDNWNSTDTQPNTSILTDGNLISMHGGTTCVPDAPATATLNSVKVFFSNLYNHTGITSPLLSGKALTVVCENATTCTNGLALLSFHSSLPLPIVDISQDKTPISEFGLSLTAMSSNPGVPAQPTSAAQSTQLAKQVPNFLTPNHVALNGESFQGESGAPLVSSQGLLLGIHLSKNEDITNQGIRDFLQQSQVLTHPATSLQQNWRNGMVKYYEAPIDPSAAKKAFQVAFAANPEFLAANDFVSRASVSGSSMNGSGGRTLVGTGVSKPALELPGFLSSSVRWGPLSFPFWILVVAMILILLMLLALISLLVTALRRRQEYIAAKRRAAKDNQLIAAQESGPQSPQAKEWLEQQPTLPMQQSPVLPISARVPTGQLPPPDLRCPRCGEQVPPDANYCTNCRLLLSPTESGLHLRIKPTTAPQPIVFPPAPTVASLFPQISASVSIDNPHPKEPILSGVRCSRCNESVPENATFCPNCRLPIKNVEAKILAQSGVSPLPKKPSETQEGILFLEQEPAQAVQENSIANNASLISPSSALLPVASRPEPQKNEPELKGKRLGNYRLIRLLGEGAFADVYLGEHIFLKTQAAIKVLRKRLTQRELVGFVEESRTVAGLIHPHIVRVLEFGLDGHEIDLEQSVLEVEGRIPYLVMDYAPGGTLRTLHPKGICLPSTTIILYVNQIADALYYAHSNKLIHLDVKPENMLIGRSNQLLLSDFGISAVAHSEQSMNTREAAGTAPYMAPEQIRGKPRPASDQYALAIVVYEWLCGTRPFRGTSQWAILEQHLYLQPASLREKLASIAPEVEAVVLKALNKDPQQRFVDVKIFASALEQALK